MTPGVVYVRWVWCRAVLHRGWWLVTSVYLVADAHLRAPELVLIGVAQAAVALLSEVPAGILADTFSRKWSLVVSHALMGTAMLTTPMVSGFTLLMLTQMLWGLSWTFATGADVAWVSDELGDPDRIPEVLIRAEQAQLTGTVAGLATVGGLAWLTGRTTAMALTGAAMLALGLYVVMAFREHRLPAGRRPPRSTPPPTPLLQPLSPPPGAELPLGAGPSRSAVPARSAAAILADGLRRVRRSRVLTAVVAATFLVNGVADAFGRLYPLRLLAGAPAVDPTLWFTGLGVLMCLAGAGALRLARPRIGRPHTVRRGYVAAAAVAAAGIAGLAIASGPIGGSLAVLLAAGALPLTRSFGTVWVNGQTPGAIRATVHSLVAQAEYAGKILCGLTIAFVAGHTSLPVALAACAALLVLAISLVQRPTVKDPS
jgi:MFS transporter, DHA3 family, tetracycline resistance protein